MDGFFCCAGLRRGTIKSDYSLTRSFEEEGAAGGRADEGRIGGQAGAQMGEQVGAGWGRANAAAVRAS